MLKNTKYAVFRSKKSIRNCEMISWSLIICVAMEIGAVTVSFTILEDQFKFRLLYLWFHTVLGILMIIICICSTIILRSVHKELSTINTEMYTLECVYNMDELKKPENIEHRLTQTPKCDQVASPSKHKYSFVKNESLSNRFDMYSEITDSLIPPKETKNPIVENQNSPHLQNSNSQLVLQQNFGNTFKEMASNDLKCNSKLNTIITNDVIPLSHTLNRVSTVTPKLECFIKKSEFESNMDDLDKIITDMQSNAGGNSVENLAITDWKDDKDYDYIKN